MNSSAIAELSKVANNTERIGIHDLEIKDVCINFGDLRVIENMSFNIRSGEFVSLLGPSGCGKSTLLRLIAGLLPASSGSVRIGGQPHLLNDPIHRIGLVFQKPLLLPWRTTLENVLLPIEIENGGSSVRSSDITHAKKILSMVQLSDFEKTYPNELSGGMQQRVALARALISDPEILLMDEPFGALDEITRDTLNEELLRIWQSNETRLKTIIMVTHSIPEAAAMSDRVLIFATRPARLLDVVDIPIPHPRNLESTEYIRTVKQLRSLIRMIK